MSTNGRRAAFGKTRDDGGSDSKEYVRYVRTNGPRLDGHCGRIVEFLEPFTGKQGFG